MAVLKKTRIEGSLTAEAGITVSGGVLTAASGTIDNLTSNNITVNTSVNVGSNTTLTDDSISTDTAEFNTITATTYNGLPRADETTEGIVMLSDVYTSGAPNTAASVIALNEFATSIKDRIEEFELDIRGASDDAFDKNPPTLWSVKNYADQMSITDGDILDDVPDDGNMSVEKATGSPTLNIHIKKFVTQTEFEVLNNIVEELTGGDTGIITDLNDRVNRLESALPISSFGSTTVVNYVGNTINNRLGWSTNDTVQEKLNELNSSLSGSISQVESNLESADRELDRKITINTEDIRTLEGQVSGITNQVNNINTRLDGAYEYISRVPTWLNRAIKMNTNGSSGGKIRITLENLVANISNASNYIYIVCLNGFVLRGPTVFPVSAGNASIENGEYIFVRGTTLSSSYIETTNTLLANQEMMVIAFGYNTENFSSSASTRVASETIAKAAKILW